MASEEDYRIEQCFLDADSEFGPDKSTVFLIQITAERMNCNYARVVRALEKVSIDIATRSLTP